MTILILMSNSNFKLSRVGHEIFDENCFSNLGAKSYQHRLWLPDIQPPFPVLSSLDLPLQHILRLFCRSAPSLGVVKIYQHGLEQAVLSIPRHQAGLTSLKTVIQYHNSFTSRVMRKAAFLMSKNRPRSVAWYLCRAGFCFRYIYSTIPLLSKSKISRL